MKKLFVTLNFILLLTTSYAQNYTVLLERINVFLNTFDNGYYGHLEIKNDVLFDFYKNGTFSKINIYNISQAKVVDVKKKIAIYCNNNSSCVTTNTGATFDNMPFSTNNDFNADDFADKINALILSYKNKNSVVKTNSPFIVGSKVKVINEDKKYSLSNALLEEKSGNIIGTVVGYDLESVDGNWYSGRIRMDDGKVKQFQKAQFQIIK